MIFTIFTGLYNDHHNSQNLLNFYKLTKGIYEGIQNPSMLE